MFDFQTHTWTRLTTTGTSPANQGYVDGVALWEDAFLYAFVQPYDLPNADPLMYRLDLQKKRWGKVCFLSSVVINVVLMPGWAQDVA